MTTPSLASSRQSLEAPPPYEALSNPAGGKPSIKKEKKLGNSPAKAQHTTTQTKSFPTKPSAGPSSSKGEPSDESGGGGCFKKIGEAFSEKKNARAAQKKIDYYEKLYGFVPKNVMTEAKWSKSRKNAPKQCTGKLKSTVYMGHWD